MAPASKGFISDDEMDAMDMDQMKGSAEAGLEHAGNAATFGYLPQIEAAIDAPAIKIGDMLTGSNLYDTMPSYVERRDANIARMKKQEEDFPTSSTIGTVGGSVASAIPSGAALLKLPGLKQLGAMAAEKGAGLASRIAAGFGRGTAAAGAAGIQGVVSNPGDVEGEIDPIQGKQRLQQGALSAATAGPLHALGEGSSSVGKYIANRAKDKAEKLAFRALGPFKRQANQNRDQINEIGREALDSGIIGRIPRGAAGIEERAQEAASASGKELGDLTEKLIQMEGQASSSGMSRKQIADNLRSKLLAEDPAGIPGIGKRNKAFSEMASEFEQDPMVRAMAEKAGVSYDEAMKQALAGGYKPKPLSFGDLRKAKMAVQGTKDQDGLINWNRLKNADIPIDEQFHRALASELRQGEEQGAMAIEEAMGAGKTGNLERLKKQFGLRSKAAEISGNKADAQRANQILGLKDAITGGAGATLGGTIGYQMGGYEGAKEGAALGGAVGALGNKIARDYGAQVSAKTLDSISKMLEKSPVLETILKRNPTLIPQLVESLERQNSKK